jgi:nucleoside-diphosphate-sugar epimerase
LNRASLSGGLHDIDAVIHLATDMPVRAASAVDVTRNLMKTMEGAGPGRLVLASSSVYELDRVGGILDEDSPVLEKGGDLRICGEYAGSTVLGWIAPHDLPQCLDVASGHPPSEST